MNFSAWSIRNPVAPLLAFAMLLLVGIQSFNALPITRIQYSDGTPAVASFWKPTRARHGLRPSGTEPRWPIPRATLQMIRTPSASSKASGA